MAHKNNELQLVQIAQIITRHFLYGIGCLDKLQ